MRNYPRILALSLSKGEDRDCVGTQPAQLINPHCGIGNLPSTRTDVKTNPVRR
jgi:hypothetical protein